MPLRGPRSRGSPTASPSFASSSRRRLRWASWPAPASEVRDQAILDPLR